MRTSLIIAVLLIFSALAQAPLLGVSTLVREDIFAGFMTGDMERFEKGVQTLDRLESEHPDKVGVRAWQAGAQLYRAVRAYEAKEPEQFRSHYDKSVEMCRQSGFPAVDHVGVLIVCGGSHLLFADRLPEAERAKSWQIASQGYQRAAVVQADSYKKFPLHIKGELLAGLAQSAQRTGENERMRQYLNEIIAEMPNTVYAARAQKWVERPEIAATTSITCLTCHDPGRLQNRMAQATK